jgi:hypothetical protein
VVTQELHGLSRSFRLADYLQTMELERAPQRKPSVHVAGDHYGGRYNRGLGNARGRALGARISRSVGRSTGVLGRRSTRFYVRAREFGEVGAVKELVDGRGPFLKLEMTIFCWEKR